MNDKYLSTSEYEVIRYHEGADRDTMSRFLGALCDYNFEMVPRGVNAKEYALLVDGQEVQYGEYIVREESTGDVCNYDEDTFAKQFVVKPVRTAAQTVNVDEFIKDIRSFKAIVLQEPEITRAGFGPIESLDDLLQAYGELTEMQAEVDAFQEHINSEYIKGWLLDGK